MIENVRRSGIPARVAMAGAGAVLLAVLMGGVSATPAAAQSGSRICGVVKKDNSEGYALEVKKNDPGPCNEAVFRAKTVTIVGGRTIVRNETCEKWGRRFGLKYDPCLRMHRVDTTMQADNRGISTFAQGTMVI